MWVADCCGIELCTIMMLSFVSQSLGKLAYIVLEDTNIFFFELNYDPGNIDFFRILLFLYLAVIGSHHRPSKMISLQLIVVVVLYSLCQVNGNAGKMNNIEIKMLMLLERSRQLIPETRDVWGNWSIIKSRQHKSQVHYNPRDLIHCRRLTLSLPESNLESIIVVVPFKSVDETSVCDHWNESYWAVLTSGAVCFRQFCKMKFKIFSSVLNLALLGVKGLTPCSVLLYLGAVRHPGERI